MVPETHLVRGLVGWQLVVVLALVFGLGLVLALVLVSGLVLALMSVIVEMVALV